MDTLNRYIVISFTTNPQGYRRSYLLTKYIIDEYLLNFLLNRQGNVRLEMVITERNSSSTQNHKVENISTFKIAEKYTRFGKNTFTFKQAKRMTQLKKQPGYNIFNFTFTLTALKALL